MDRQQQPEQQPNGSQQPDNQQDWADKQQSTLDELCQLNRSGILPRIA